MQPEDAGPNQKPSQIFQSRGNMIATRSKRVTLCCLSLEKYIDVLYGLTNGNGNVVQPHQDPRNFTLSGLRAVLRVHGLPGTSKISKEEILKSLVGKELWNPSFADLRGSNRVPEPMTEEEMQEDLLALEWLD